MARGSEVKGKTGLQVIGAGLPRTGTSSLKQALEVLGFEPCHHTETVASEGYPYPSSRLWQKACVTEDREVRRKILRELYDGGGFRSGCDYPTALFVDELIDLCPEAKVGTTLSRSYVRGRRKSLGIVAHSRY